MSGRVKRCPKCRSKDLSVVEITESVGITWPGEVMTDRRGDLIPPSDFEFESGDIIGVFLLCDACRHEWRSRVHVSTSWEVENNDH